MSDDKAMFVTDVPDDVTSRTGLSGDWSLRADDRGVTGDGPNRNSQGNWFLVASFKQ